MKGMPIHLFALFAATVGCLPGANNMAGTDITGTIAGSAFTVASASADRGEDGSYVVTLADTPEFSCSATSGLPMNYLQVVIGELDSPGTYDADGRVFFNVFVNGVSAGEAANSGTVSVDDIGFGTVDGFLDASGPESSVVGSFSAEICN